MMTLSDFLLKYAGHKVDFDGAFGAQCVDLFRQYNQDVWENPHTGAVEGAKDLWLRFTKLPREMIYLQQSQKGRCGDVAVWDASKTNPYGHVAIYLCSLGNGCMLVFEQNGFAQDGAKFAVRSDHNLLGYLQKKE